jgi:hypothetical protein
MILKCSEQQRKTTPPDDAPTNRPIDAPEINSDSPLRLDVAAKIAFPFGGMTASGLRREAKRGRLIIERIAGKDYTTLRYIEEMRGQCRNEPEKMLWGGGENLAFIGADLNRWSTPCRS